MEKAPRDLPLYSSCVLTILETVITSRDISMVEESLPTFETFCKYQDISSLTSDPCRSQQYQNIVQMYAEFASNDFPPSFKQTPSKPMVMRWKTAGLRAIRSVVGAEALGADGSKQLSIVMPVILDNLYAGDDDVLASLQEKAHTGEKTDVENARRRRMSIATVTTVDTVDFDPATASASGTTADADKAAEDQVRVLAVRCLREIFAAGSGSNRGQIRLATIHTLKFITGKNPPLIHSADSSPRSGRRGNWATSLVETVARWTPVQDRFIIAITAVDALIESPIEESELKQQLTLATMIDWLLSSSINLIGLSVMDVLLGFVQHVVLLLQLGGRGSKITPHRQQADALEGGAQFTTEKERGQTDATNATIPSPVRQELLLRLQRCIGDLATHIYYTDQISDMMSAVLARLKPSSHSDISSAAAAIENPVAAANAIANSVNLQEDPLTDSFFSFATARVTALRAVKNILLVANVRKSLGGATAEARSRVGVQVWEGTQWLLRDGDPEVRVAYVDALLTWLKLETNQSDLLLPREGRRKSRTTSKGDSNKNGDIKLAKRAISNASRKDNKKVKSNFLQLLHLAIYENARETPQIDSDILLLHLLLTNLTERLGVNAVRYGLPMIARLQDDLESSEISRNARAKINVGSLVHGYLWALSEKFSFEIHRVGSEIQSEVSRRKRNGLWLEKVRVPALPLEHIVVSSDSSAEKEHMIASSDSSAEKEHIVDNTSTVSLKPYESRVDLVEEISTSYNDSLVTPATSPPSSPGRVSSVPALSFGYGYGVNLAAKPSLEDHQLPQNVKDELLAEWSRDSVIAAVESARSDSVSGSRTGTGSARAGRNFLAVDGVNNGSGHGRGSPVANGSPTRAVYGGGGTRMSAMSYALNGGLGNLQRFQRAGADDGSPSPLTASSSRDSTVRVAELKRALSGYPNSLRHSSPLRRPATGLRDPSVDSAKTRGSSGSGSGSESMVSYSEEEGGVDSPTLDPNVVEKADFAPAAAAPRDQQQQNPKTETSKPRSSSISSSSPSPPQRRNAQLQQQPRIHDGIHTATTLPRANSDPRLGQDVPPVPKIPSSLNLPGTFPRDISPARAPSPKAANRHHQAQAQPQPQLGSLQNHPPQQRPSTAPHQPQSAQAQDVSRSFAPPIPRPNSGSLREGRSLTRRERSTRAGPRPATSDGGNRISIRTSRREGWGSTMMTVGSGKSRRGDLRRLLEGIKTDDDDEEDKNHDKEEDDKTEIYDSGGVLEKWYRSGLSNGVGDENGWASRASDPQSGSQDRGRGRAEGIMGPTPAIRPPY